MKRVVVLSLGGLLVAGSVRVAGAQSLADVARVEQERRRAVKQPAKVYTEADVRKAGPLTTAAARPEAATTTGRASGGAPADPSSAAPAEGDKVPVKAARKSAGAAAEEEAAWRAKAQEAREGLARSERLLGALEQQAMRAAVSARNATLAGQTPPPDADGMGRLREIARLRADVERFKAAVGSLDEEARRAGVPPGWVR